MDNPPADSVKNDDSGSGGLPPEAAPSAAVPAASGAEPNLASAKTGTEEPQEQGNLTELSIAVFLFSMLGFLIANIVIFEVAVINNDRVCALVAKTAASAVVNGLDARSVQIAVQREMVNSSGGFFIIPPRLTGFLDEKKGGVRTIKVQTQSYAKLPVQKFIWSDDMVKTLTLRRTYVVQITDDHENKKSQDVTTPHGN